MYGRDIIVKKIQSIAGEDNHYEENRKRVVGLFTLVLLCSNVTTVAEAAVKTKTLKLSKMKVVERPAQPDYKYAKDGEVSDTIYKFPAEFKKVNDTTYNLFLYEGTTVEINTNLGLNDHWVFDDIVVKGKEDILECKTLRYFDEKKNWVVNISVDGVYAYNEMKDKSTKVRTINQPDTKYTIKLKARQYGKYTGAPVVAKTKTIKINVTVKRDKSLLQEVEKLLIAETPYRPEANLNDAQKMNCILTWQSWNLTDKSKGGHARVDTAVWMLNNMTRGTCAYNTSYVVIMWRAMGMQAYAKSPGAGHVYAKVQLSCGEWITVDNLLIESERDGELLRGDNYDEYARAVWVMETFDQRVRRKVTRYDEPYAEDIVPAYTVTLEEFWNHDFDMSLPEKTEDRWDITKLESIMNDGIFL